MKTPTLKPVKNLKMDSFINTADGGNPVENTKEKSVKAGSCFSFTARQREVFYKIRDLANESTIEMLLFLALEYTKEVPLNYIDYIDYLGLITERGKDTVRLQYPKRLVHQPYKDITSKIKKEWYPVPMKGVVLMYLLHYVKNKYNVDITMFK